MTSQDQHRGGVTRAEGGASSAAQAEVDARIVYWGVAGAGKTTNVRGIYAKLRSDHRGRLRELPTRLDPTQTYDVLPIELGLVQGARTRLHIVTVPGGPEHAPTRKQLLDRVDGVVFVVDAQRDRIDENVAALEELRSSLAAYGRSLEQVPLVLLYNKRDLTDPYALEELHRKLAVAGAAAFEGVAIEGTGVLQALTTISKRVIRARREVAVPPAARPAPMRSAGPPPAVAPLADADEIARTAARAQNVLDASWQEITSRLHAEAVAEADIVVDAEALPAGGVLQAAPEGALAIASVGEARRVGPRSVRVPLVLHDETGREHALTLTISLDALLPAPGRGGT